MKKTLSAIIASLVLVAIIVAATPVGETLKKEIITKDDYIDEPTLIEDDAKEAEGVVFDTRPLQGITSCNVINKDVEIQRQEEAKQKALEEELARQEAARKEEEARIAAEKAEKEKQQLGDGSYIWQLANAYLGTPGMCETVSINFVKQYSGVTVVTDINTYDVSYENAQPGDMVVYSYGHQGVYLGNNYFLNPNNNGTTTISNIWDFGTPTFKRWNGTSADIACLNATMVGYGYQSIAGTQGCDNTDAISEYFWYIDEIGGYTNDTRVLDSYGYSY